MAPGAASCASTPATCPGTVASRSPTRTSARASGKPETTSTFEGGYRYTDHALQLSLTGYFVKFYNRLLASSISATIVGNQNVLLNVGSVTSRGVEAAANWRFAPHWSLYGSWAFNRSTYDDNVAAEGEETIVIKGNQVVGSPRNVGSFELDYDDGKLWGQLAAHYRSRRYYSYTNDASVAGTADFNFSGGYRFSKRLDVQVGVTNLFDKHYVAAVGTSGFVTSDADGTYSTLQTAAPRQVSGTVRVHF